MLAVYYTLRTYSEKLKNSHVKVYSDNYTTVSVITKMGTSKSETCNTFAKTIWEFCIHKHIWITCAHIPGVYNVVADTESRRLYKDAEWQLHPKLFKQAVSV